jgi:hypothetical protein
MSRYYATQIRPTIPTGDIAAHHAGAMSALDVMFDWQELKIPRGGGLLTSVSYLGIGIDNASDNMGLKFVFAKNKNVSLGTTHAATLGLVERDQIVGALDVSKSDSINLEIGPAENHKFYQNNIGNPHNPIFIGDYGNDFDVTTNPGFVTIYVAVVALEANNLSTGIILNQAGNQAATTTTTTLTVDGVSALNIIRVGDTLVVGDEAVIGTVTAVTDANTIVVDKVLNALEDDDEIYVTNPLIFNFGFQI